MSDVAFAGVVLISAKFLGGLDELDVRHRGHIFQCVDRYRSAHRVVLRKAVDHGPANRTDFGQYGSGDLRLDVDDCRAVIFDLHTS
ncbi:MAG: hypothetical protein Q7S58_13340 [Candidatus Binatus sp.]|uniref:hypothetical protein n=1 Tax=Candidatus Binatus sp. TaxID=2811406 RepID=UPI00271D127D|nr:hypothetical protein [Candidatus Binatus sp.]MDO8433382.1 hypothetical protein [Candidatus Binatus sp.]